MKKLNYIISIVIGISVLAVIIPFVLNFFGSTLSHDSKDWQAFGSYFNGMISPILAILNLIVLIKINSAVSSFSIKEFEHNHKTQVNKIFEEEDFSIELSKNLSEKVISKKVLDRIDEIEETFNMLRDSNDELESDLKSFLSILGVNDEKYIEMPYYKNQFSKRDWEILNIRARNVILRLKAALFELRIAIYMDIISNDQDKSYLAEKLEKAEKSLIEFSKTHHLAD